MLDHDLRDQVPVLFLRLRRAVLELGVPLVDLAPVAHALSAARGRRRAHACPANRSPRPCTTRSRACHRGPHRSGRRDRRARQPRGVGRRRSSAPRPSSPGVHDVRFLSALRRGNVHGALDAGLAPGFLPGRVDARRGPRLVHRALGRAFPPSAASTPRASCAPRPTARSACSCSLGADPDQRLPRRDARAPRASTRSTRSSRSTASSRSRRNAPTCSCRARSGARRPAPSPTSKAGCSGSGARSRPRAPRWTTGGSRPSSRSRLGRDLDLATVDEVTDEIARVAPAFAGVDRRAR